MAIERRDKVIGDNTYSILLPAPTKAIPLSLRAAVLFSPIAGLLSDFKTLADPNIPQETKIQVAMTKLGEAIAQVDPDKSNMLLMDAVSISHLTCNNNPISSAIDFERHFNDFKSEVFQVMAWCLWECVSDFFPQLGGIAQEAKQAAQDMLQSQKTGQ